MADEVSPCTGWLAGRDKDRDLRGNESIGREPVMTERVQQKRIWCRCNRIIAKMALLRQALTCMSHTQFKIYFARGWRSLNPPSPSILHRLICDETERFTQGSRIVKTQTTEETAASSRTCSGLSIDSIGASKTGCLTLSIWSILPWEASNWSVACCTFCTHNNSSSVLPVRDGTVLSVLFREVSSTPQRGCLGGRSLHGFPQHGNMRCWGPLRVHGPTWPGRSASFHQSAQRDDADAAPRFTPIKHHHQGKFATKLRA